MKGSAPERRSLPEPARSLWTRTRPILVRSLDPVQTSGAEYALAGGTILAARWSHRNSHDIDLIVPPSTKIHKLADSDTNPLVREMAAVGGRTAYNAELRKFKIVFEDGQEIDLWARDPVFGKTKTREILEGRWETTLSSAQILRGKMERGVMGLPRDVYDVMTAAVRDPDALADAANTMPREVIESLAWTWIRSTPGIYLSALNDLHGITEPETELRRLGTRAGAALHAAAYSTVELHRREGLTPAGARVVMVESRQATAPRRDAGRLFGRESRQLSAVASEPAPCDRSRVYPHYPHSTPSSRQASRPSRRPATAPGPARPGRGRGGAAAARGRIASAAR